MKDQAQIVIIGGGMVVHIDEHTAQVEQDGVVRQRSFHGARSYPLHGIRINGYFRGLLPGL